MERPTRVLTSMMGAWLLGRSIGLSKTSRWRTLVVSGDGSAVGGEEGVGAAGGGGAVAWAEGRGAEDERVPGAVLAAEAVGGVVRGDERIPLEQEVPGYPVSGASGRPRGGRHASRRGR